MDMENVADLIIEKEAELGREMNDLEKAAFIGAAINLGMKFIPKVYGAMKGVLSPNVQAKAKQWGGAISKSYARNTAPGMNLSGTQLAGKLFQTSARSNPMGTAAATVGTGIGVGAVGNKIMQPKQPAMPRVAEEDEITAIIKEAGFATEEEKKQKRDNLLFTIGGLSAGALLGARGMSIARKAKNAELLGKTELLRGVGKDLVATHADVKAAKAADMASKFEDITDVKQRTVVHNTVKDLDKLIQETGKEIYVKSPKDRTEIANNLKAGLSAAAAKGELPPKAYDYLERNINSKIAPRDFDTPFNKTIGDSAQQTKKPLGAVREMIDTMMHPEKALYL